MAFNLKSIKEKVSKKMDDTYVSKKTFNANPALIPMIADKIKEHFQAEGFEVQCDNTDSTYRLFLTKGDLFKAVAGLKMGLVVSITPVGNDKIDMTSSIDNYKGHGKAVAAGAAASIFALPLAIPAIIGTVKQAHLDEKPIEIASDVILNGK